MAAATHLLDQTKDFLRRRDRFLHLKGNFHLTKTASNFSEALLERDFALEEESLRYISQWMSESEIIRRYSDYDSSLQIDNLPPHYPMRVLSGAGSICSGSNIFMFFPLALGLQSQSREDAFGFELINIWANIFQQSIFSCVEECFHLESQINIHLRLRQNIERTIYLASIFHELGHEVGPWRVSPSPRADMKLDGLELDILGELATDSLMILNLPEFKEIPMFIILQRLFWSTRRGYRENPLNGNLNTDNDAWIGIYLWEKLKKHKVLCLKDGCLVYDETAVTDCFKEIIHEIDNLFLPDADSEDQRIKVRAWQQGSTPTHLDRFTFPEDLRSVFARCQHIVEVPHFHPSFQYHQINQIKSIFKLGV